MWIEFWGQGEDKFRMEVSQIDWICGLVVNYEGL